MHILYDEVFQYHILHDEGSFNTIVYVMMVSFNTIFYMIKESIDALSHIMKECFSAIVSITNVSFNTISSMRKFSNTISYVFQYHILYNGGISGFLHYLKIC